MISFISMAVLCMLLPAQASVKVRAATTDHSNSSVLCRESTPGQRPDTTSINGKWYLVPVLPSDTAAGKIPYIVFNEGSKTFTGSTGCNDMRGSYQRKGYDLVFSQQMAMTKRACQGFNEKGFVENLLRADHYKFEQGDLVLLFGDTQLSKWSRKPVKASRVLKT